jgi:hypothetical protein
MAVLVICLDFGQHVIRRIDFTVAASPMTL